MLEQWLSDEAATNHEWSITLTDDAVDIHDDQYVVFGSSTRLLDIQPVPNATDSFLFKPKIPGLPNSLETEVSHNLEYTKADIMKNFIKVISISSIRKDFYQP